MSYNIDQWKLRKVYVELPDDTVLSEEFVDMAWDDKSLVIDENEFWLNQNGEQVSLHAVKSGNTWVIDYLQVFGEGSGHAYDAVIEFVVHHKGTLQAVAIWEGGDSTVKVDIVDGVDKSEDVNYDDLFD